MGLIYNLLIGLLFLFLLYQVFFSIEPSQAQYYRRLVNKTRLWKQVLADLFS